MDKITKKYAFRVENNNGKLATDIEKLIAKDKCTGPDTDQKKAK